MKSIKSNSSCKDPVKPYPKLMEKKSTGGVVFMSGDSSGTTVYVESKSLDILGYHSNTRDMSNLVDYTGDICLTND